MFQLSLTLKPHQPSFICKHNSDPLSLNYHTAQPTTSMDVIPSLTFLEHCRISPPSTTIGHRSLSLTFFDTDRLLFPPTHYVFFYEFKHSKSHFLETIVPKLKHSLSVTLQHFFPLVSNLVVFPNPDNSGVIKKPEIRHVEGDYTT